MSAVRPFLTSSGILPPFPSSATAYSGAKEATNGLVDDDTITFSTSSSSLPRQLLSSIRSLDKQKNNEDSTADNNSSIEDDAMDLLNHLIAVYVRRGLLQGNTSAAEQILASSASNNAQNGSKKNKSGAKKKSNEMGVYYGTSQQQQQPDEALVFTAVLRILPSASTTSLKLDEDRADLISLAAELCVAIIQHILQSSDICALAEYELLAQHGKDILTGLHSFMEMVIKDASNSQQGSFCLTLAELEPDRHIQPLQSTLKAACYLISVFGTKLSRSTQLIQDLHTVALKLLTITSMQASAAKLVACLPMCGGTDRTTPSDLWDSQLQVLLSSLSTVLSTMAPLAKNGVKNKDDGNAGPENQLYNVTSTKRMLEEWIQFVRRRLSDESSRADCFQSFIQGLTIAICALLQQDHPHADYTLLGKQVNVTMILEIIESFVSFPLTAESTFYKTKKRLRDELVDDGLLSPRVLAMQASNHIKQLGHKMLDIALSSLGAPVLLPYARRIFRICYASILTSSSGTVRRVMDPASVAQLEGKRRRWLHLSVFMRARSVQTFERCITAFGCDNSEKGSNSYVGSSLPSTDGERAISLVVGCLLEQIGSKKTQMDGFDDDWGTQEERIELVVSCFKCLGAVLASCGGFLSMSIRSLIESVAESALSSLKRTRSDTSSVLSWAAAKVSLLELACRCATTPWQDGASSSIVESLTAAAQHLEGDEDLVVATCAKFSLRTCEVVETPKAPALVYISRANSGTPTGMTADSLAESIQTTHKETVASRRREAEAEEERKSKREQKRILENERKFEQAVKRQRPLSAKEKVIEKPPMTPGVPEPGKNDSKIVANGVVNPTAMDMEEVISERAEKDDQNGKAFDIPDGTDEKSSNPDSDPSLAVESSSNKDMVAATMAMNEPTSNICDDDVDEDLPEIFVTGPDSDEEG